MVHAIARNRIGVVAAAIFNEFGEPIAGISVSGPTVRLTPEVAAAFGPLVQAAADVTRSIAGRPPQRRSPPAARPESSCATQRPPSNCSHRVSATISTGTPMKAPGIPHRKAPRKTATSTMKGETAR